VKEAADRLRAWPKLNRKLFLASSEEKELAAIMQTLSTVLAKDSPPSIDWHYEKMPEERHATIFHPAALKAFRSVLKPPADKTR
jgi:hypothetical protein